MGKIDLINAIGIALIYLKRVNIDMISDKEALEFKEQIDINLEKMNSKVKIIYKYNNDYLLDIIKCNRDENGNMTYELDSNVDLDYYKNIFINNTNLDILIASQNENALDVLGLEKKNSHIIIKKDKTKVKK